ncbi:hypothetical protein A2Z33_00730 [Candidatus Gottesmanbacteria bacterium RBG_16_52_11]|uniref:Uncharacterized protein n=1 Tax=Candidatus Gottesmanbacteria bacterium RBG_16_52_11 TaxID=1798374 RepID=A0A1F5YUV2_9BACT|nr:MAG: hypothetical protein A2Z33_00730 [Candidatus Gottesmanbacteria bacterium RBG_16_52_11]
MAFDELKVYRSVGLGIVFILLIGVIAVTGKLYWDSRNQLLELKEDLSGNPSPAQAATDAEVIERVRAHMVMPDGTPKVITVTGVADLRAEQPFFAKAQEGDKLLVYPQSVILYSPTLDRVVEVAQIRYNQPTPSPGPVVLPTGI